LSRRVSGKKLRHTLVAVFARQQLQTMKPRSPIFINRLSRPLVDVRDNDITAWPLRRLHAAAVAAAAAAAAAVADSFSYVAS
jgi:hypothetical protein